MNIFRKHKAIEDLLPDFLMTKEIKDSKNVFNSYARHINTLVRWLDNQGVKDKAINKIRCNSTLFEKALWYN